MLSTILSSDDANALSSGLEENTEKPYTSKKSRPLKTAELLKQSGNLLRRTIPTIDTPTVPIPRSLSSFIDSFEAPKRTAKKNSDDGVVATKSIEEKIEEIRKKPWAKHFTDEQLMRIASERPQLENEEKSAPPTPNTTRTSSSRLSHAKADWRRKLAGILPKQHRPSLDRLNDNLDDRLKRQTPQVTIKKAPEKWHGVKVIVEPVDEGQDDDDDDSHDLVDAGEPEEDISGNDRAPENTKSDDNEGNNLNDGNAPPLIIDSSDTEEEHPKDGKKKLQTNISAFFTKGNHENLTVEDLREAGRRDLTERQERKRSKKERRIRSAFFDEEAEESDSDGGGDVSADDDDDNDNSGGGKRKTKKSKANKKTKGRTVDSDEEIDEAAIRRELIASKFIAYQSDASDGEQDDTTVYNKLDLERDAVALQQIVDRFARDKLDPKARHLQSLAKKYSSHHDNNHYDYIDDETVVAVHGDHEDDDDDHLADLIRADSDLSTDVDNDNSDDMMSDYEEPEDVEMTTADHHANGALSRPSSVIDLQNDNLIVDGGHVEDGGQTGRRYTGGRVVSASLLSKLEAASGSGPKPTSQGGFTVGNSIAAD